MSNRAFHQAAPSAFQKAGTGMAINQQEREDLLSARAYALSDVIKALSANLSRQATLAAALQSIAIHLGYKAAALGLYDRERQTWSAQVAYGLGEAYPVRNQPDPADSAVDREALQGRPVLVRDVRNDPRCQRSRLAEQEGIRSILAVPLRVPPSETGPIAGVLRVYAAAPHDFSPQETAFLQGMADVVGYWLANAAAREALEKKLTEYLARIERLQAEAERAREEAQRAIESRAEFVADISHDLRTPLSVIIGYVEMLLEAPQRPLLPGEEEALRIVMSNAQRLLTLMNDLVDMSLIESGKFTIEAEPVALAPIVQQAVQAAKILAERQGIRLTAQIDAALPIVNGDGNRIRQVVSNLIVNAIRFTPGGGEVCVRAYGLSLADKQVERAEPPNNSGLEPGEWLVISVADTGLGIAPDEHRHLFTRLHRSAQGGRRSIQGTGIGMYVAKAIVDAHGGRIVVESEPGKGSIFKVALRALPNTPAGPLLG
jgi:signal transduction histidine kinase